VLVKFVAIFFISSKNSDKSISHIVFTSEIYDINGLLSKPTELQLNNFAEIKVVPLPANGSTTNELICKSYSLIFSSIKLKGKSSK